MSYDRCSNADLLSSYVRIQIARREVVVSNHILGYESKEWVTLINAFTEVFWSLDREFGLRKLERPDYERIGEGTIT